MPHDFGLNDRSEWLDSDEYLSEGELRAALGGWDQIPDLEHLPGWMPKIVKQTHNGWRFASRFAHKHGRSWGPWMKGRRSRLTVIVRVQDLFSMQLSQ